MDNSSDKGIVSNARRVPRVRVASYTIDGFMASSDILPQAAGAGMAAIAKDLKKNQTASAFVEGFASLGKAVEENVRLAHKWAFEMRDRVILLADDQTGVSWQRFETVGQPDKSRNSTVITIDRPDMQTRPYQTFSGI